MMRKETIIVYASLAFSTSIWGSAFIAGKYAVTSFEPATIAFLRFFFAAVILYPLMWVTQRNRSKPTIKDWALFALLGITGITIYNICFFMASKYATVIKSSLFIAINPVLITLLSYFFLKEKLSKKHFIGMIVALLGVIIIITNGQLIRIIQLQFQFIDLVLLLAVITWALYSVLGKLALKKYNAVVSTTYAIGFGTLFLVPFVLNEITVEVLTNASISSWLAIIHMSIFVTVVSFIMYYNGIKEIGAAKASIFINVMPVSAVILATILLDEVFTLPYLIGALFVIGGVSYSTITRTKKKQNIAQMKKALE
ncbi:EamA family transporter [Lottiidibacillus patelloidae]|uniref:EamA family transporter n=1 Tax=Lottiidibacillus patelloidae TaxID=2670334 RepID=A0A263BUE0_9BACI|nr:DMT family transporter [Lottiidibacillus patelloidae]OZM57188.1 EamA family transporter [Lottiidibacillus patelloidae]